MEQRGEYEIAVKLYDLIDVSINHNYIALTTYLNFILNMFVLSF